jgi:2-oxoglutarate dehydrogenase E2 component (dihydrolipoamide succinyltransferase)
MPIADLIMPKLGESIMEATILKWHKKVGDHVKLDETVLDIATDKVDSEVPSTVAGVITEILFNINDVVPIGTAIAKIETASTASTVPTQAVTPVQNTEKVQEAATPNKQESDLANEVPYSPKSTAIEKLPKPAANRFYSPLVLNIANSEGVGLSELERIPGTGNDGRVSKKDILQYVADKKAGRITAIPDTLQNVQTNSASTLQTVFQAPQTMTTAPVEEKIEPVHASIAPNYSAPSTAISTYSNTISSSGKSSDPSSIVLTGSTEIIEMDRMRKLIANHMVNSKHTSPHVTSFAEADVTNMVIWREKVKKEFEQREGTKITFTPMFIECIVKVMQNFPLINCSLDGDKIVIKKDINIGMATALPSGNLIVPVIKGANQLNIVGLCKSVNNLADAARNARLKPEDTTGGTFTLTNVGTFGSLMGTPIINQPQVAILAVGAIKKRAVVIESSKGDSIGIRHMMYLSLSYDHRIVDGSIGASFLTAVAKEFENWDVNKQWFHYI